jgi:integrase
MPLENALNRIEQHLIRDHKEESTINVYKSALRRFCKFFPTTDIDDIAFRQIKEYFDTHKTRTVVKYALQVYYNEVLGKTYKFNSIKLSTEAKKVRENFTKEEIKKLLEKAEKPRDRLMFAMMYHFELDRGDLLGLQMNDFAKRKDGVVTIKLGPKRNRAIFELPKSLSRDKENYLQSLKNKPSKWLFENRKDTQLSGVSMDAAFKKALGNIGINKKPTTRSLKLSHAEHSKQAGIALIDEILDTSASYQTERKVFVEQQRIDKLRKIKSDDFDLTRLIQLCEELNGCAEGGWYLAISMLIRAIMDHVPPIFGYKNFAEVVNNYSGGKSFKQQMEHLENSSRKIADRHLHTPIRNKEDLPTYAQIDFKSDIDVLLSEIVRVLK